MSSDYNRHLRVVNHRNDLTNYLSKQDEAKWALHWLLIIIDQLPATLSLVPRNEQFTERRTPCKSSDWSDTWRNNARPSNVSQHRPMRWFRALSRGADRMWLCRTEPVCHATHDRTNKWLPMWVDIEAYSAMWACRTSESRMLTIIVVFKAYLEVICHKERWRTGMTHAAGVCKTHSLTETWVVTVHWVTSCCWNHGWKRTRPHLSSVLQHWAKPRIFNQWRNDMLIMQARLEKNHEPDDRLSENRCKRPKLRRKLKKCRLWMSSKSNHNEEPWTRPIFEKSIEVSCVS